MNQRALAVVTLLLATGCASRPSSVRSALAEPSTGALSCTADEKLAISDEGALVRRRGGTWSRVSTPATRPLRALWGTSCRDVWVVGDGGTILWGDGRDFWIVPSPVDQPLTDVRGTDHDDVWARAEDGTLIHFDGDRFQVAFTTPSTVSPPAKAIALFKR